MGLANEAWICLSEVEEFLHFINFNHRIFLNCISFLKNWKFRKQLKANIKINIKILS